MERVPRRAVWPALLLAAAALGWVQARQAVAIPDGGLFERSATALLHGRLDEVYADPLVQAGPFELLWVAVCRHLPLTLLGVAALPLTVLATRALRIRNPALELTVAALTLPLGIGGTLVFSGHPSQVVVPVAWVAAAYLTRNGNQGAAGAVLGLAAGWEVWAVLGAPVLLLGGQRRRAATAAAATAALSYVPFAATGEFHMFDFRWSIQPGTLPALLGPDAATFPWPARAAQAAAAVLAAAATARALRHEDEAIWLVPLMATAVRLVLDPIGHDYYWTPIAVLALVGLVSARTAGTTATAAAITAWQLWPQAATWQGTAAVTLPLAALATVLIRRTAGDHGKVTPARRRTIREPHV